MGDHIDFQKIALSLFAGLLAVLTWIGRRQIVRIDNIEAAQAQAKSQLVTREELARLMAESRSERAEQFRATNDMLSGIHRRVDALYQHMGKK